MTDIADKQSLMIVDDNPLNIQLLVEVFSNDYDVIFASSGLEALTIAAQTLPDLILLDIQMPGMSGYEVCKALKSDPLLQDIPVIFVTAMSQQDDEINGLELGAVDYITKPFNMAIVQLRVRTHIELRLQRKINALRTAELEVALANIRTLQEILPVCMYCKKIRDDDGYWSQLDSYIREHTDSEFSHGICPDCLREHYGEEVSARVMSKINNGNKFPAE
jgi:CheY-like chemotaxis protein